jgi:hypothetical protein
LCLLLLGWLGLVGYVMLNRTTLLEKMRTELRKRVGNAVQVGSLDISFFRHFPDVTVRLNTVSIRDTAWQQHHHDLLKVAGVDVELNLFKSLWKRRVQLGKVGLDHGQVYFYTDSTGYSNTNVLKDLTKGGSSTARGGQSSDLPDIGLSDIRWVMERQDKHKLFDLDIRRLNCSIDAEGRQLQLDVRTDIRVNNFSFNTEKGSFVKDRELTGNFGLQYSMASKIIQFKGATVKIDGHPFVFSGRFFPTVNPDPFFLTIETHGILFHQASALLTPNITQKVDQYDMDKPVNIFAQLDAGAADQQTPQVQVHLDLDKGSVLTPAGRWTAVSFKGSFINEWVHGQPRGDENSGIRLLDFSGALQNFPLRADTVVFTNLTHPQLFCDLHSRFDLTRVNELTGSETIQFTGGTGTMDLVYKGPLSENDTSGTTVNGHLDLDSSSMIYLPYQFKLTGGHGRLLFKDQDLLIDPFSVQVGKSTIAVKGVARNLVALLDRNEENVSINLNLSTPRLQLEDVVVLAGRSQTTKTKPATNSAFGEAFARVDRVLKEGTIRVGLEAANLSYQQFTGAHAKADILFNDHQIRLNKLNVQQAGGTLQLQATLNRRPESDANPLTMQSRLDGVDIPGTFAAFDNFGQDALSGKNLKGKLTADIGMNGELTGKARLVPNSLKGTINFDITNGQLVNFEPLEKLHEKVLKNKDLSLVRFADLNAQLDLDSTTVTMRRMEIRSTAFTLFAEGTYDLKRGPDMSLQIPLSNLSDKKDQGIPPESRGNDSKAGLSVRLRARRGDDGKLKITWDPFKKALKKAKHASGGAGR